LPQECSIDGAFEKAKLVDTFVLEGSGHNVVAKQDGI
jgi:hypothetical protein